MKRQFNCETVSESGSRPLNLTEQKWKERGGRGCSDEGARREKGDGGRGGKETKKTKPEPKIRYSKYFTLSIFNSNTLDACHEQWDGLMETLRSSHTHPPYYILYDMNIWKQ